MTTTEKLLDITEQIQNQYKRLGEAAAEMQDAHSAYKQAKEAADDEQRRLNSLVSELCEANQGYRSLFDQPGCDATSSQSTASRRAKLGGELAAEVTSEVASLVAAATEPVAEPVPAEPEDEAWRAVPLTELNLPGSLIKTLASSGIKTLGDIADYTAGDKLLTDIKGVGQGKADKIEAACAEYWGSHPHGPPAAVDAGDAAAVEPVASAEADKSADQTAAADERLDAGGNFVSGVTEHEIKISKSRKATRGVSVTIRVVQCLDGSFRSGFVLVAPGRDELIHNLINVAGISYSTEFAAMDAAVSDACAELRGSYPAAVADVMEWRNERKAAADKSPPPETEPTAANSKCPKCSGPHDPDKQEIIECPKCGIEGSTACCNAAGRGVWCVVCEETSDSADAGAESLVDIDIEDID